MTKDKMFFDRPLLRFWHDLFGHKNAYAVHVWLGDSGQTAIRCDTCGRMVLIGSRYDWEMFVSLVEKK